MLYGLPWDAYLRMLDTQLDRCASCGDDFEETPSVDHDHETGEVRAILCRGCNTALGHLHDDPVRVLLLLTYIESHK